MLCGPVAMFLKVTTMVSPSTALSVGPSRPAEEGHAEVYWESTTLSDVIVSLLGLLLGCFDMRDSQQNQDRQETPSSSPGMEPHIGDQSSRGSRSALQNNL
ncbi:hypothetical protein EYF80_010765 [Liparis tanakae]|uniref:Uncharacterized protein n=1 Tax=Liparis tanakae TaxID=230148 RepID=A0A4Z2IMG1_9TELE|nr:hypothetical protein EYF80_010765 [Liparis tanakae]